jgi:hypothetical protein
MLRSTLREAQECLKSGQDDGHDAYGRNHQRSWRVVL